jgi:ribonuclease HI
MKEVYIDWSCNFYYNFRSKKMDWDKSWWIWIVIYENWNLINSISESYKDVTNQKMELLAIIRALENIEWDFILYSDSQYALNCTWKWKNSETWKYYNGWINNWKINWKLNSDTYNDWKPVLFNRYYIRKIQELIKNRNIKLIWVRWHNFNEWNEKADILSQKRDKLRNCEFDEMEIENYIQNTNFNF